MTFRRARSEEQREERRRAVLATTAAMLAEMPVAAVTLNEISRRVGLAKSNVLRYVESREAALLALLDEQSREWLDDLGTVVPIEGTVRARVDRFAEVVAESLAARPVLCDLVGAQSAVLEHNVSTGLAGQHKHRMLDAMERFGAITRRHVPELHRQDVRTFATSSMVCAGTMWTNTQPSVAMRAAYDADPRLSAVRFEFVPATRELVAVVLCGLLARAGEHAALS